MIAVDNFNGGSQAPLSVSLIEDSIMVVPKHQSVYV